jgi:hypothetical protein
MAFPLLTAFAMLAGGCDMGASSDPSTPGGGEIISYSFDGIVFEDEALGIFDYSGLLMNGTAVMDDIDVNLTGSEILMDFSTSKNGSGDYVWNGMTLALNTASYNPVDLSSYGALTFKAKVEATADGNNNLEKVGFALGSDYEIFIGNKATLSTDYQDYIIPLPDSSKLTSVTSLFYFTDSAASPDRVFIDDVKFITKSDVSVGGMGYSNVLDTYAGTTATAMTLVQGTTKDLGEANPFWINFLTGDADGTWANDSGSNVFAVNGKLAGYYTWASDAEAVATVNEFGVVSGVSTGSANITASLGGTTLTFAFTVSEPMDFSDGLVYTDGLQNSFAVVAYNGGAAVDSTADFIEGTTSLAIDLSACVGWGGANFEYTAGVDASGFTNLVFSANTAALETSSVDYMELKGEDVSGGAYSQNLFGLTPSATSGDWDTYTIPLTDFSGVDFSKFKALGFWHPKVGGVGGTFTAGSFSLDNVHFE